MTNRLGQQLRITAAEAQASRFQRFARDAPIGIVLSSADGAIQFANDEYLRIVGRSREEFDADRFRQPSVRPSWLRPELGARYESESVRPDGSRLPVLVGLSRQEDGLAAFLVDLSAEKEAQRGREESEERYRAAAEKLAEADRRKDEFFGVLSHELRNPLAAMENALHVLVRAPRDDDRAARGRDVIARQLGHLTRLVDDLLDVARITRGRVELQRAPLDLRDVVRDTVEDHRAALDALGLALETELPPAPVPVDGDATRLAQILGNLLANSAKFTPRGGTIRVQLGEDGGAALLRVRDTGEGIEADVLARIFEPFSQADRSLARSRGGLGLGLTLVKHLVELHGGTVAVSSPGAGAGTEVRVRLPLALATAARRPHRARTEAPSPSRVLVVEDNADAAETLRIALELEQMDVTVAPDGATGLAAARLVRPDVILCDVGLPGELDGYAVARAVRGDPALRATPLVALTGYAGPEDRARAIEAGFDLHLPKPAPLEAVLGAMSLAMQR